MKKMMLTIVLAIAAGVWTTGKAQEVKLNSLCDEWNIAKISGSTSLHEEIHTVKDYDPYLTPDPLFPSDTRWHYVYEEMYGGPDFTPIYFSDSPIDTVINNTHYQRIKGKLFRSEGAKVWCAKDSMGTLVERLVYDFDLQVGDSIRNIFYEDDPYDVIPSYAKVTKVENITLSDGRSARRLSYDAFRYDDIEHIGSLGGFLAPLNLEVPTCGCGDHFQCCTRGDFLLFEIAKGACDTFMEDNHPYVDTIPLFIKDGPGTSTIDPVDPNLIYALLQGELLTIKDFSGAEIFCTLVNTTIPSNSPHHVRLQAQPFRDSLSVEITDAGLYEINLTSEAWNYSIYGSFVYGIKEGISLSTPEQPSAQKFVRNGQILILRGDKTYTLTGQEIK